MKIRPLSVGSTPLAVRTKRPLPISRSTRLDAAGKRGLAESERRRRAREAAVLVEGDHVTHLAEIE